MIHLKLIQIGNSVGVVLPKELLAELNLEKGDTVLATRSPTGYSLTALRDDLAGQVAEVQRVMRERRAVLRELAK